MGLCCFTLAPGEEASGSGQKCWCCLLLAWRWAEPPACLSQETKRHTNQNKTPVISRDRPFVLSFSASLRFTTTTATYGHRVPTELCPTWPVVFCGSASHSLPPFVCSMVTHRRWCSASCLTTKTHHRQTLAAPLQVSSSWADQKTGSFGSFL